MDDLMGALVACQRPDQRLAFRQLLTSAILYAIGWILMVYSLPYGYWLTCLLAVPTAGFFLRLFMIQHDCGHGSFFSSRKANDALGFVLGVVTLSVKEYAELSKTRHGRVESNCLVCQEVYCVIRESIGRRPPFNMEPSSMSTSRALHIELVELVSGLIPEGTQVVFLGDGEFDGTDLQDTMNDVGWFYVCCTAKNTVATWEDVTFRLDL